jgi:hypothetical protein
MHLRPLFLLMTSACSLTAGGKAQPHVRFLAERAPTPIVQVAAIAGEKRSVDFDLPVNYLSRPIEVPGRFFQVRCKQPDAIIANIQLPETGDAFVSLLIPAKNGGYNAIVIPTDEGGLKPGSIYLYNHSDATVMGRIGTSKFIITTGTGQILKPEGAHTEKFYDVAFGVQEETGPRVFSTTRWPADDRLRSYVFFFKNPTSGRPDYRAVDDFVPPEAPKIGANP